MGEQLEAAKKVAPTRPHPRSPDTPPGNLFAGLVAGSVDKARNILKAVVPKSDEPGRPAGRCLSFQGLDEP